MQGYTGEPMVVNVLAVPASGTLPFTANYDTASIVLAGQSYRPEGAFGSITSPTAGSTLGGETLDVTGRVSGVFENTFILTLVDSAGNALDSGPVTVFNPYFVDEVPWTAELTTGGYTGAAEIRALYYAPADGSEGVLASAPVTVQ